MKRFLIAIVSVGLIVTAAAPTTTAAAASRPFTVSGSITLTSTTTVRSTGHGGCTGAHWAASIRQGVLVYTEDWVTHNALQAAKLQPGRLVTTHVCTFKFRIAGVSDIGRSGIYNLGFGTRSAYFTTRPISEPQFSDGKPIAIILSDPYY